MVEFPQVVLYAGFVVHIYRLHRIIFAYNIKTNNSFTLIIKMIRKWINNRNTEFIHMHDLYLYYPCNHY